MFRKKVAAFLLLLFSVLFLVSSVFAMSEEDRKNFMKMSEEERKFLLMYFDEEELVVVSSTRSLKSITRVAENVEVISAADIELMGAHTLADVLNTVNGVQVSFFGASPGIIAPVSIQGSRTDQVVVLVDGISLASIGGGTADLTFIPAQIIERVEIIKGPASSAWGSSLGGVVNVITKSSPGREGMGGLVSGSYGEKNTGDFRAELNGKKNSFGYYLFAGNLQSDGLRKPEDVQINNLYAKFTYDFDKNTNAALSVLYNKSDKTVGDYGPDFNIFHRDENILSSLSVTSRLSDSLTLDVSAKAAFHSGAELMDDHHGSISRDWAFNDSKYGGSMKLDWKQGMHDVVIGTDYDIYRERDPDLGMIKEDIMAVFVNDTITIGRFSFTPGLRFDTFSIHNPDLKKDFASPSLGMTYALTDKTLLRAYVSRGFNIPAIAYLTSSSIIFTPNPKLKFEKVNSYQIGVETGELKYLWLKLAGFRHDVSNSITPDYDNYPTTWTYKNMDMRKQGVEAELRTLPFYNFTLSAGTTYIYNKDFETGERMKDFPELTYNLGLQYDDKKSLRALLKGNYIKWNTDGEHKDFIFDLNMIKSVYKRGLYNVEAFMYGHNLFNGSQYSQPYFKNARRWIEAGIRIKF